MCWFRVPQAVKDLSLLLPHMQEFCLFCKVQIADNKTCLHADFEYCHSKDLLPEGILQERWRETLYRAMQWQNKGEWFQTESRFIVYIRKKFFTQRMMRPWNGLCREVVNASSLEMFQACLDGALRKLVQWKVEGLELDDL